ncbi:MAG: HAD family hydrolase [Spirochaetaceae bacterium]|nr:HAD family hydrolase [Spirochaetaceae bacterium]
MNTAGKDMKTLYVTDLDGTLLNSKNELSDYTVKTLNELIDRGMCFSYATARSLSSASIVTKGLTKNIPVIVYNGTSIINPNTKEKLFSLSFSEPQKCRIIETLNGYSVNPLIYGFIDGEEKVSWLRGTENAGMTTYIHSRQGDPRLRPVESLEELYRGDLFYVTCIGEQDELQSLYQYFSQMSEYTCTFQQELYRTEYWFEMMPEKATKGNAILVLKEKLGCEKIVSFGDAINDIPMFHISDESYAVENAVDALKQYATGIIPSNDRDGVAHWLSEHYTL